MLKIFKSTRLGHGQSRAYLWSSAPNGFSVLVLNCYENWAGKVSLEDFFDIWTCKMTLMYRLHDNVRDQVRDKNLLNPIPQSVRGQSCPVVFLLSQCSSIQQSDSIWARQKILNYSRWKMSAMVVGHYPKTRRNALTPLSVSSATLDQESCVIDPES